MAEVLSFHGKKFFEERLPILIQKCIPYFLNEDITDQKEKDEEKAKQIKHEHDRESYMSVFIYLPLCYIDFEKHLSLILPIFYEGLSDESDEIRKLSNRVLKISCEQFGKSKTQIILDEILKNIFNGNYWLRFYSM